VVSNADLIKRLRKFLDERAKMKGVTPEIHGLHLGTERQAQLTVDDLEQAVAILQAHEWRTDMENAPRDGTEILLTDGRSVHVGRWDPLESIKHPWRFLDDTSLGCENSGLNGWTVDGPTHWKPLDTPPDTQNT
jgi:hypothetical protein